MKRYFSRPMLVAHLVMALGVGICGWLGAWQFGSWQTARDNSGEDTSLREPIALNDAFGPDAPFPQSMIGQPVVLDGQWVPDSTMLISNRLGGDERDVWVVSALQIEGGDSALLIVRGLAPHAGAVPAEPEGPAEFVGWLEPPEGDPDVIDEDANDRTIGQLRIADAIQLVDVDLYGGFAFVADRGVGAFPYGDRASNPGTEGLETIEVNLIQDAGTTIAIRNVLYAFEWWFFGAFVVFMWQRWVRDNRESPAAA